jgi:hypothetical protein
MQLQKLVMAGVLSLVLLPGSAFAQEWYFTPFVGGNFGGNADFGDFPTADDEAERRLDFGASLGWQPRVVGFEVDFGWSPNFFADTVGDFDFGDSNVTTLMGNLVVGAPLDAPVQPYATGGFGLIRTHVDGVTGFFNELNANDFGANIGGGLKGQFNEHVGIRGDLRYFRSMQDNEAGEDLDLGLSNFDFWRGTVGLSFHW